MIYAIEMNLLRGVKLLNAVTDKQYSDKSIAPYYSSIGGHMRHILDIFDCIFEGLPSKKIDLAARKRNVSVEEYTLNGLIYFEEIFDKLKMLHFYDLNEIVEVKDDLGLGEVSVNYTLAAALAQAHSHATHHFASIGYIISQLGIELPDEDFGYNPTTPKKQTLEN
ncbi:MAG: DinB family protein [Flavobacteriaceae bacterium]|nr:DinB family protein [Flavobacteriaceae bacterium]